MGKLLDVFYTKTPGRERANPPDFGIEIADHAEIDFHGETGQLFIRKTIVAQTMHGVKRFRLRESQVEPRAPEQLVIERIRKELEPGETVDQAIAELCALPDFEVRRVLASLEHQDKLPAQDPVSNDPPMAVADVAASFLSESAQLADDTQPEPTLAEIREAAERHETRENAIENEALDRTPDVETMGEDAENFPPEAEKAADEALGNDGPTPGTSSGDVPPELKPQADAVVANAKPGKKRGR
jgi:hypothetical protein